jgi:hypothetical protein
VLLAKSTIVLVKLDKGAAAAVAAVEGSATSNDGAGIQPQPHMADDLPGCEDERREGKVGVQPRRGGRDRSCMGRRRDEDVVRPWYRKDRQGISRAVDHTHRVLPCDHAVGIVHNLLHACHRTRAAACGGGSHRGGGCSHEGGRDGRSSRRRVRVGNRHHGGPSGSVSGICHDRDHLVRQGLHTEP